MDKELVYDINGYKYKFVITSIDGGIPYGICKRLRKRAWLYDRYIQFEDGHIQRAKRIF